MTPKEYQDYELTVAEWHKLNDCKAGCCSPVYDDQPFFSWRACEICQRPLGGTREEYLFATEHGETFKADICVDCIYYLAYGKLDDQTMLEIADAEQAESAAKGKAAWIAEQRATLETEAARATEDLESFNRSHQTT